MFLDVVKESTAIQACDIIHKHHYSQVLYHGKCLCMSQRASITGRALNGGFPRDHSLSPDRDWMDPVTERAIHGGPCNQPQQPYMATLAGHGPGNTGTPSPLILLWV